MSTTEGLKEAKVLVKKQSINFHETITVIVGSESNAQQFAAHKDVLCKTSTYFTAALTGDWKEKGTKTVKLHDEDPLLFAAYLEWAYTGVVVETPSGNDDGHNLNSLIRLYVLADRFGTTTLKNQAMDLIMLVSDQYVTLPSPTQSVYVWNSTPPAAKLREYLIDQYIFRSSEKTIDDQMDKGHHEMIAEICRRMLKRRFGTNPSREMAAELQQKCYYHEHNQWAPPCEDDTMSDNEE